ncbi:MAG: iron ABC transporter permease [Verrucomicrobiales bacterium]|nr:iron ABC transporter permease [Verrucomicrobiales bacterium]
MEPTRRLTPGTALIVLGLAAFFGVFLLYPVGYMLREAFLVEGRFTLRYFVQAAENPLAVQAMINSTLLASLTTLLTTLLTLPLAHFLTRYAFRGQTLLNGLLLVPLIMPPFVGAIGLKQLLARYGSLNLLLTEFGLNDPARPLDWLGSGGFWGIVVLQVLSLYPVMYLNVSAALAGIDPALREAAQNLGATPWRQFRTITLPLLLPGWFAGAIIVFIWSFTDLGTPLIFGYSASVPVLIFDSLVEINTNPLGYAMVVSVVFLTLALFLVSKRFLAGRSHAMIARGHTSGATTRATPRQTLLLWLGAGTLAAIALLPHLAVLLQSVAGRWFFSVLPDTLTSEHFRELAAQDTITQSLRNSLTYSSLSALLDLVIGVAIAWVLTRRRIRFAGLLDAVAMLPLALPGLVIAFGYVAAFDVKAAWLNPRENPTVLLVISYAIRRLPYIVRSAYAGFQQTSLTLEEASANLGASSWRTLRRITLPLVMAHLVAGTILTFSLAMLEVSDGLILAMKESFYPITKMIWLLMGRIDPNAGSVACALGVVGMLILASSLLLASRLLGKSLGQLFRS